VVNSIFTLFAQLKEVSELFLRLSLWIKIHVELFLQIRPCLRVLSLFAEWSLFIPSGFIKLAI
jgi:hypothetical protein